MGGLIDSVEGIVEHALTSGLELLRNRLGSTGEVELPCPAILRIAATLHQIGLFKPVDHAAGRDGLDVEPLCQRALIDARESHDLHQRPHLRAGDAERSGAFVESAPVEARDIVDNKGYMMLVHRSTYNKCAY